jgi:A/G-specific adenine glycosylase
LPDSLAALHALPGIGKTTAHAILAFGFRQPYPILEANVKRILARLYALESPSEKTLWACAWEMLDTHNTFDYNQSLMDLGALVCTAKSPACARCPLRFTCKGADAPLRYPAPKIKKPIPRRHVYVLVAQKNKALGLVQHEGRFLHGLWGLPQAEVAPKEGDYIGTVNHAYSHFALTVDVFTCKEAPASQWFDAEALARLPLSTLDRKILALVGF